MWCSVAQLVELCLWIRRPKQNFSFPHIPTRTHITQPSAARSEVNKLAERHLKHLTPRHPAHQLSLLAQSSSCSGQTNKRRSLSHLQKEDPSPPTCLVWTDRWIWLFCMFLQCSEAKAFEMAKVLVGICFLFVCIFFILFCSNLTGGRMKTLRQQDQWFLFSHQWILLH